MLRHRDAWERMAKRKAGGGLESPSPKPAEVARSVMRKVSKLELEFASQLHLAKLDLGLQREFRFCARKWKLDFAWPERMIAVETHGGLHTAGRHTRGSGFEADREKINCALELGWRVLELTPKTIKNGSGLKWTESLLQAAEGFARHIVLVG